MSGERILCVDDDRLMRRLVCRMLEPRGYAVESAGDVAEARALLAAAEFALVLCDVNMPGESGLELLRELHATRPGVATVMVTAQDDTELAEVALDLGAYGYVIKPFEANELLINVANALRRRRLELEQRAQRERLERAVLERTTSLRATVERLERSEEELRRSSEETIRRLASALEHRDEETGQHVERMSRYCALLAKRLGLAGERRELIRIASPLHDVGKLAVPDRILAKPGPLTVEERAAVQRHAAIGYEILAGSTGELLRLAATIALTHHERWDGGGYPHGLAGAEIPLEGRIAAVADVFDALTSERSYRDRLPLEEALSIMRAGRATAFDPSVLDRFLDALDEVATISRAGLERVVT